MMCEVLNFTIMYRMSTDYWALSSEWYWSTILFSAVCSPLRDHLVWSRDVSCTVRYNRISGLLDTAKRVDELNGCFCLKWMELSKNESVNHFISWIGMHRHKALHSAACYCLFPFHARNTKCLLKYWILARNRCSCSLSVSVYMRYHMTLYHVCQCWTTCSLYL